MGISHRAQSTQIKYEDPAGVFRPGCCELSSISWLPLWPRRPPHLHPCLAEGEARRKRSADEAEEVAAPAPVLAYSGLPLGYAGYPYAGYAHYPYAGSPAVTVAEPKVTEVEIPQIVYKPVEKKIDLAPLCF